MSPGSGARTPNDTSVVGEPTVRPYERPVVPGLEFDRLRHAIASRLFGMDALPPRVGRFEILHLLGRGGMGAVYLGRDGQLGRTVAIKVLERISDAERRTATRRMLREAKALARLNHPNVVPVLDVGIDRDAPFVAMEYVRGATLDEWCRSRAWGTSARVAEVLDAALQTARGLLAAHEAGLVHRDVKPSNVLVGDDGRVRVVDFGLARDVATVSISSTSKDPSSDPTADEITRPGSFAGTPLYMAPEQFEGRVDALTDQFGWACTFYEAFYDVRPFAPTQLLARLGAITTGALARPRPGHRVPGWIRRLLARCLQALPKRRMPSFREIVRALERGAGRGPSRAIAMGGAACIGAIGFGSAAQLELQATDDCSQLAGITHLEWTPATAEHIRSVFAERAPQYGDDVWVRVDEGLRAYDERWLATRTEVCEAARDGTLEATEAEARLRCLNERRQAVRWLVDRWRDTDKVWTAPLAMAELPPIEPCHTSGHARDSTPAPEATGERELVRGWIARARAHNLVGDSQQANALLERALAHATEMHDPELLPLAAYELALLVDEFGQRERAETLLSEAYYAAQRNDLASVTLDAALELALRQAEQGRMTDAQWWLQHARSELPRLRTTDEPSHRRARFEEVTAIVARRAGRYEESRSLLEATIARCEAEGITDPVVMASLHRSRAAALTALARYQESERALERALEFARLRYGDLHPRMAVLWEHLAAVQGEQGRLAEAERSTRRAMDIQRTTVGTKSPGYAVTLYNLSVLVRNADSNRREESLRLTDEALEVWRAISSTDNDSVAIVYEGRGITLALLGRHEEARASFLRALGLFEEHYGPEHPDVAMTVADLAVLERMMGNPASALQRFERARTIYVAVLGEEHPRIAALDTELGITAAELRLDDRALGYFERSIELHGRLEQRSGPFVAACRGAATIYVRQGRPELAVEVLRRAAEVVASGDERFTSSAAPNVGFQLAKAEWAAGAHRSAIDTARRVLAETPNEPDTQPVRDELRTWLAAHGSSSRAPREPSRRP